MTPDLQKEFKELRTNALQQLRNVAASGSYIHMFTLIIEPSFEPFRRLTVYAPRPVRKEKRGLFAQVSHAAWRSDLDGEKFRHTVERLRHGRPIVPTIEADSWEIEDRTVLVIRDRLSKIAIPIFPEAPSGFGLDGTSYEFQCHQPYYGVTLKWWEHYPAEWRPFTEAVIDIYNSLTSDGHRPPLH